MYFYSVLLLAALFVSSLQKGDDKGNLKKVCHAPETYANTICALDGNQTFPVSSETKARCFCSYDGENITEKLIALKEKSEREVELTCEDNGTWSSDPPICSHNTRGNLEVPIIKMVFGANKSSVTFTQDNFTLFPIFASGRTSITLYRIEKSSDSIVSFLNEKLGNGHLSDGENLSSEGYPFSMSRWPYNITKMFVDALIKYHYQMLVHLIRYEFTKWDAYKRSAMSDIINSSPKAILLNATHDQEAVITGAKLELLWDFEVSKIEVDGEEVKCQLEWNENRLYPQVNISFENGRNISTMEICITSPVERYEWPLYNITLSGENGDPKFVRDEMVMVCGNNLCHSLEYLKKCGGHFRMKIDVIKIYFTLINEGLSYKIILGFYECFDVKLKTRTMDIQGIRSVNKNQFFIEFPFPEPIIVHSGIEFTLESSIGETWYWPIKQIQLEGQNGHPEDWCASLKNITKIVTTVDMCIHFAGERKSWKKGKPTKERLNYSDAERKCAKINGSLVEPRSKNLQDLLASQSKDFQYFWIGIHRFNNTKKWQWKSGGLLSDETNFVKNCYLKGADNKTKELINICENSRNQSCVVLQREYDYKWIPRGCEETCKYICQSGYIGCGIPHKNKIAIMNIIETKNGFPFKVHYECPEGFQLKGKATRTCTSKGVWSDEAPTCEEIRTSEPVPTVSGTWKNASDIVPTSNGSDQEPPLIFISDETNGTSEVAAIIATSVIVICTILSVVLISVVLILCWKRRGSGKAMSHSRAEILDRNRNAEKGISSIEPIPGRSSHSRIKQHKNLPLSTIKDYKASSSSQKSQQAIEMVESDIYDSYDPQNVIVENDIYGTM